MPVDKKYVVRRRGFFDDDFGDDPKPLIEGKTIFEAGPIDTGLIDHNGDPIYRVKPPIGFLR